MSPDCRQSPGVNTIPSNAQNEAAPYVCTVMAKDVFNITTPLPLLSKTSRQYSTSRFLRKPSYFLSSVSLSR